MMTDADSQKLPTTHTALELFTGVRMRELAVFPARNYHTVSGKSENTILPVLTIIDYFIFYKFCKFSHRVASWCLFYGNFNTKTNQSCRECPPFTSCRTDNG